MISAKNVRKGNPINRYNLMAMVYTRVGHFVTERQ